jgi:hypothetical protein
MPHPNRQTTGRVWAKAIRRPWHVQMSISTATGLAADQEGTSPLPACGERVRVRGKIKNGGGC